MTRKTTAAIVLLSVTLAASLGLNVLAIHRAKLFYLQLNAVRLDPIGLAGDRDSPRPSPQGRVVVFLGDSRAKQWPAPDQLKDATVVNRGIGNQTTAQILLRFQAHVAALKPDVVVLQVGVNDLKTIPLFPDRKEAIIRDCETNIARLVKDSLQSGARVVVTTIFPLGRVSLERRPFWSDDVAAAIIQVNAFIGTLSSERVTVLNTGPILSNPQGMINPRYSQDLLHLTAEGYAALNQELGKILAR